MKIKNKNGEIIFSDDLETMKQTVEAAVKTKVSLAGANLRWDYLRRTNLAEADLRGADLRGANFYGAYLAGADLRWTNLSEADLCEADLAGANLEEANLRGAKLSGARLGGANLAGANLEGANLKGANLEGANLEGANLARADLEKANLSGANLSGANLARAYLRGANLRGANLTGTCLDPANTLPSLDLGRDAEAFSANAASVDNDPDFVYGWRTATSAHCPTNSVYQTYEPGGEYVAPWFSTAETDCHPGLYLAPSVEWLKDNGYQAPFVMVRALRSETVKAGGKYRCKRFWVL